VTVSCELCGCDEVNGWREGEPCPDCELCCCGHNGFAHAAEFLNESCFECSCPRFTSRPVVLWDLVPYVRWLPVLYELEGRLLFELRSAWASGRRVALSLERCDYPRMEGIVTRVAPSGAYARVRGRLVPLDRVLALHWPSRLGDSDHRRAAGWAGAGRRCEEPQEDALW
jgi:hypothetical protein